MGESSRTFPLITVPYCPHLSFSHSVCQLPLGNNQLPQLTLRVLPVGTCLPITILLGTHTKFVMLWSACCFSRPSFCQTNVTRNTNSSFLPPPSHLCCYIITAYIKSKGTITLSLQNTFSDDSCILGGLYLQAIHVLKIQKLKKKTQNQSSGKEESLMFSKGCFCYQTCHVNGSSAGKCYRK